MKSKKEMMRVLKTAEGEICLDITGKKNGRGCYLCASIKCFNKARKSGKLASHLECEIPDEVYAALEERLARGE